MRVATSFAVGFFVLAAATAQQPGAEAAKQALVDGNQRFVAGKSAVNPLGPGIRRSLARGQNPSAIVLCCADSRVPPEHVFNAGLGELFVVRQAGNCVDPEALASIEYAAEHLGTQLLVVLGHERCGAIAAAIDLAQRANAGRPTAAESPALQHLLDALEPAVQRGLQLGLAGSELSNRAEEENAQAMAVECLRRSELLRNLQKLGRFLVLPARYHLDSGVVDWLPPRALPPEPTATASAEVHAAAPTMAPHVALRMLQAGHRRFLGDGRPTGDITAARREALTQGQQPFAIVVTCADSRVAPEHVFDAGLGDLFVIRVAGNVLNDDVLASVEYAAAHTGSPLLVVLGHSACGAVTAAVEHGDDPHLTPNLRALVERLQPAVERSRPAGGGTAAIVTRAVRANAQRFVAMARQQSPILRQLEREGRFAMLSAVYELATGDIEWLPESAPEAAAAPAGETQAEHAHAAGGHEPAEARPHGDLSWADEVPDHDGAAREDHHDAQAPTAPGHGAHDSESHGADTHGDGASDHGDAGHAAPDHDGHHDADGDEGAHGSAHDAHAEATEAAPADRDDHAADHGADHADATAADGATTDHSLAGSGMSPVLVLGITGILSLLTAAAIALKHRS